MRVLCKESNDSGALETFEINDIGYDDDTSISGLYMSDYDGNYMYIKNIPLFTCNEICKKILETGYYDLSDYDAYEME